MCVIIYKPSKATITKKTLSGCWQDNPDSGGFMFADNDKLNVIKGFLSFRKFYKRYRECERKYPDSNFVIHFRIATHGKIDYANSHPFYVGKNVGFAHNGVLGCMTDLLPTSGNKSDTNLFCENVLKKLPSGFLKKQEYQILLESLAKQEYSKFVFMTNKGTCHIFNEDAGTWKNGCWFSSGIKKIIDVKATCQIGSENWYECGYCGDYCPESELVKSESNGCFICLTCLKEIENENSILSKWW